MFMFEYEVRALAELVRAGESAYVVAHPGTGASTVLTELGSRLESEGFSVHRFSGHSFASDAAWFTLQEAGVQTVSQRGQRSVGSLVDLLSEAFATRERSVVLIDALEFVDQESLLVLQASVERTRAIVVFSRSRGFGALKRAGVNYTLIPGARVELQPLDYARTARLIGDRLGSPPSAEIVSRVYSSSGGLTGLVLAIIDGALRGGAIGVDSGRWEMLGTDLWSPAVDGWLEANLSVLSAEELDALQHLALAHDVPHREQCSRLPSSILRSIEDLGYLSILSRSSGTSYVIEPPAVSTFLRAAAGGLARLEIDAETPAIDPPASATRGEVARTVRVYVDRVQASIQLGQAAWEQSPVVATALPYVTSLLSSPRNTRTVRAVFQETPLDSAESAEAALDFVLLRLLWFDNINPHGRVYRGAFDGFLALYPSWSNAVALFAELMAEGPSAIIDTAHPLTPEDVVDMPGGDLVTAASSYAHLLAGDFAGAKAWLDRIPSSDLSIVQLCRGFVSSLSTVASGDVETSLRESRQRLDEALERVDHSAILLHAYSTALSLLGLGRWRDSLAIVDLVLAFGFPGPVNSFLYRAMLFWGAWLNAIMGNRRIAEIFLSEADSLSVHPHPLPGAQDEIGLVVRYLLDAEPGAAMDTLRVLCLSLAEQGAMLAALLTLRIGLATWPDIATLELIEGMSAATQRPYPEATMSLVRISLTDPEALPAAAASYRSDSGLWLAGLVLAARLRQEDHDSSSPAFIAIRAAIDVFEERFALGVGASVSATDEHREQPAMLLSRREREVAMLANRRTNAQIAAQLGISVRTVESHLHNAFRKTETGSRDELFTAVISAAS